MSKDVIVDVEWTPVNAVVASYGLSQEQEQRWNEFGERCRADAAKDELKREREERLAVTLGILAFALFFGALAAFYLYRLGII